MESDPSAADQTRDPVSTNTKVKAIFDDASDLPPDLREAYLQKHCGEDAELRKAVDRLLKAHDEAGAFFANPTSAAPPDAFAPGQVIGRYKLLQRIGEGGFGTVYMAEQEYPVRRRMALKIIKLGMDTKAVIARFEAERQALALMDHPNIARVFDAGATDTGRPYFVMELVRGVPITDYCDTNNLPVRERLELFVQVCQAVQHAHQKGVIHRDIKPNNVMVAMADGSPTTKVIDFGIAKATDQRLTEKTLFTEFRQMIGTPQYMSPEQAEMAGIDIDTRSDVYSLGVLLYELLVGSTPFDPKELRSKAYGEMQRMIREVEPPRPSTRLSTLGDGVTTVAAQRRIDPSRLGQILKGELDWIVMRAMEKDRTRRYDSANGLARDIQRYLADEPVEACPASAAYRVRKFVRKNRGPVLAAALILLAIFVGAGISLWQANRATKAEKQAIAQRDETEQARRLAEQQKQLALASGKKALEESNNARRAAFRSEARYLIQKDLLPAALASATEASSLNGQWEDGLTIQEIARAARRDWQLFRRVPMEDEPNLCCVGVTRGNGEDMEYVRIVVVHGGKLQLFGRALGSATQGSRLTGVLRTSIVPTPPASAVVDAGEDINRIYWNGSTDSVLVLGERSIARYQARNLSRAAFRSFDFKIIDSDVSAAAVAVTLEDGTIRVLKLNDLSDLDSLNWKENSDTKQFPIPTDLLISPSGTRLKLGGFLWVRSAAPSGGPGQIVKSPGMASGDFESSHFVDDQRVILMKAWEQDNNGVFPVNVFVGRLPDSFAGDEAATEQRHLLTTDDAKGVLRDLNAWIEPSGEICYGILSDSGCTLATFTTAGLKSSTRFANLVPYVKDVPKLLCADLPDGLLLMKSAHELLVFRRGREGEITRPPSEIENFCASACDRGLLCLDDASGISLRPFDPAEPLKLFSVQGVDNPANANWVRWALGTNAAASTVVMIEQSAIGDMPVTAFTRVRAIVWKAGNLDRPSKPWPIECVIDPPLVPTIDSNLYMEHVDGKSSPNRFIVVEPTGKTFAYKDATGTLSRFSIPDHRLLESVDLGVLANRSFDGRFVAGVDAAGLLQVFDVATGGTVFRIEHRIGVDGLCFSADSQLLLVHSADAIDSYRLSTGEHSGAIATRLIPLAWPAEGANRFIGIQADSPAAGGDVFLADTTDGKPITVLTRAAKANAPAFFSPSGKQATIVRNDSDACILRSLTPDQLPAEIGDSAQQIRVATTMPAYHNPQEPAATQPTSALDQSRIRGPVYANRAAAYHKLHEPDKSRNVLLREASAEIQRP